MFYQRDKLTSFMIVVFAFIIGVLTTIGCQQTEPAGEQTQGGPKSEALQEKLGLAVAADRASALPVRRMVEAPAPSIEANIGAERPDWSTEEYSRIVENNFKQTLLNPLSTFSIDVDTASYANCRRFIREGSLPPKDAVRIEEFINYFSYDYEEPASDAPLAVNSEMSVCPWNPDHDLLMIGLQAEKVDLEEAPANNLVFLLDVSGSMNSDDKLGLLKKGMHMLVSQLRPQDRVAIVVYAGSAGMVLDSTPGDQKEAILGAIDRLSAGGSTAGGEGIELAYKIAEESFQKGANNRVILGTDGDFNVGVSDTGSLTRLIEDKRETGVFLSVLGFGRGNLKDSRMESLADKGNGNYSYIDGPMEAKKALVTEFGGTMIAVAKDVKLQIEFNPAFVKAWRLVGYENRVMAAEDFDDDKKDAGELGAGHQVTAFYELVRAESGEEVSSNDDLKYQQKKLVASDELMTLKFRYKAPDGDTSKRVDIPVKATAIWSDAPSENFEFASAVAEFGLLLRDSQHKGRASMESLIARAKSAKGEDENGYRAQFIDLATKAEALME
ncbi:MAG: vWA domain-containing protein [Candidatus Sumerlaeota bacterium]